MPETRCERCKYYAKLEVPYHYDARGYPEGVTVPGFCGKDARNSFHFYPVYLPDGGVCKDFSAKNWIKRRVDPEKGQLMLKGMEGTT